MKKQLYNALRNTLYLGVCAFLLCACQGKDGAPGPTGDPGAAGATGAVGSRGKDTPNYVKIGTITGKITGLRKDGVTPLDENFKYEYSSSSSYLATVNETVNEGIYLFNIQLHDSIFRDNHFMLEIEAPLDLSTIVVKQARYFYDKSLNTSQLLGANAHFYFAYGKPDSPLSFADMKYNVATGLLTGKYTWNATQGAINTNEGGSNNFTSTGYPMTISGQITVSLRQVSSFRISADQ